MNKDLPVNINTVLSDRLFNAIVETMNDGLVVVDSREHIVYVNRAFTELLGYLPEQLIGKNLSEFLDEENWKIVKEHVQKRRRGVGSQYELEWVHGTGDRVSTIVSASPIFDRNNNYCGSFGVITDITMFRREQEKRSNHEHRFKVLLESLNEAVVFVSPRLVIEYGNKKLFEMLESSKEDVLGHHILEFIDPAELEDTMKLIQSPEEFAKGTFDFTMVTKTGRKLPTLLTPQVIKDDEGNIAGYLGVILDISKLKAATKKIQKSEARDRQLFNKIPLGIFVMSPDGKILHANQKGVEIFGAPIRSALEQLDLCNCRIANEVGVLESLHTCIKLGRPVIRESEYSTRWRRKGYLRYQLHPHINLDGNVNEVVAIFEDITEQKQMENTARESERKYRELIENSLQGVSVIQDGKYVFVNPAFCEIVGRNCDEILAMDGDVAWRLMIHPDDKPYLLSLSEARKNGDKVPRNYSYRFVRPDGSVRWVEAFSQYIRFNGRKAFQVVVNDITEKKEAEFQILNAKRRADLYRDLMSHDIRNQLQIIQSGVSMLEIVVDKEAKKEYQKIIKDAIKRISRLINEVNIIDDLPNHPLVKRDLKLVVEQCVSKLSEIQENVVIEYKSKTESAMIFADSFLEILIRNILRNGIEHNTNAPKQLWIELCEDDSWHILRICDNGPGLSDSAKISLFDEARRFGGLGLHQAQHIIGKYKGQLLIQNRTGENGIQGTMVSILFPKIPDNISS